MKRVRWSVRFWRMWIRRCRRTCRVGGGHVDAAFRVDTERFESTGKVQNSLNTNDTNLYESNRAACNRHHATMRKKNGSLDARRVSAAQQSDSSKSCHSCSLQF